MNTTIIKHNTEMQKNWIITMQTDTIDKLSVITVSHSTCMTTKINGVATDLFCTGVIGHPGHMFLN